MGKYALLGANVAGSLSPNIYKIFFEHFCLDLTYTLLNCKADSLAEKLYCLERQGYSGCNITNPLKQRVTQYVPNNTLATMFGAANVIKFAGNEGSCAFNTDGVGFIQDLARFGNIKGAKVLLLGSGGVIAAIAYSLAVAGAEVTVAARSLSKLQMSLYNIRSCGLNIVSFDNIEDGYNIIVNATSTTLTELMPSLPQNLMFSARLYYDLSYAAAACQSMLLARDLGAANCVSGIGMLVYQAAHAMHLWTDCLPSDSLILATIAQLKT